MLYNYFRTALRYFRNHRITTLINILGLSIGISAALVIYMMISYSRSFDQFEPDHQRIYRVVTDGEWKNQGVPIPLANAMQQGVNGIENVVPLFGYNGWNVKVLVPQRSDKPDKVFKKQEQIAFTDQRYFKLLPHRWLAGSPADAFTPPNSLVLTESRAKLYFPDLLPRQVIGKPVIFSDTTRTTITGVVADLEANSDFTQQCFISLKTVYLTNLKYGFQLEQWASTNSSNQLLIKVAPGVRPETVDRQIARIFKANAKNADPKTFRRLQPLSDIHINTEFGGSVDPQVIKNLSFLAIFLLLIGAINFINLSTAQAAERAKEVGVRKTLGSSKGQLVGQFLAETFLLTAAAALLSLALTPLLIKVFQAFLPEGLQISVLLSGARVWIFLLLLVLVVSLIAGLYPAFVLSGFRTVAALKNTPLRTGGSNWLRKGLIVSQFVIAQVFVIGVLVVNKQLQFAQHRNMGFRKDAVINFYVPADFSKPNPKKFLLKQKLSQLPGVETVSLGNQSPAFSGTMSTEVTYREHSKDIKLQVASRDGDTSYLKTYHIALAGGRNVMASDTANELLINETLARQIGFNYPANAVGHFLEFNGKQMPVVGVMKDFHQASIRSVVAPLIYYSSPKNGYVMHVALQSDPKVWHQAINQISAEWKRVYPDEDFEYTFLDKTVENFYKADRELSQLLTWAAGVAILIGSLGLLGLVIFMTNRRVKEIGVRKVLGASVAQIVALLAGDFARLLVWAFVIAVPISWWQTNQWLQQFAYRTELSWWLFLIGGILMIAAALVVVGLRAGRSAMANPVSSLRTE